MLIVGNSKLHNGCVKADSTPQGLQQFANDLASGNTGLKLWLSEYQNGCLNPEDMGSDKVFACAYVRYIDAYSCLHDVVDGFDGEWRDSDYDCFTAVLRMITVMDLLAGNIALARERYAEALALAAKNDLDDVLTCMGSVGCLIERASRRVLQDGEDGVDVSCFVSDCVAALTYSLGLTLLVEAFLGLQEMSLPARVFDEAASAYRSIADECCEPVHFAAALYDASAAYVARAHASLLSEDLGGALSAIEQGTEMFGMAIDLCDPLSHWTMWAVYASIIDMLEAQGCEEARFLYGTMPYVFGCAPNAGFMFSEDFLDELGLDGLPVAGKMALLNYASDLAGELVSSYLSESMSMDQVDEFTSLAEGDESFVQNWLTSQGIDYLCDYAYHVSRASSPGDPDAAILTEYAIGRWASTNIPNLKEIEKVQVEVAKHKILAQRDELIASVM